MRNKKEATIQVFQYLMVGLALFGSQFLYAQTSHLDSINISTVEKNIRIDNPYLSFFGITKYFVERGLNYQNRIMYLS